MVSGCHRQHADPLIKQSPHKVQSRDTLAMTENSFQVRGNVAIRPPAPVPGALWIPLRNRRGAVLAYTLIDEEDAHLAKLRWHATSGYAHRWEWHRGRQVGVFLHRVILKVPDEFECDHINRNRLDNRRANLRWATRSQNSRNVKRKEPKKYKGVQFLESANRWRALITFEGVAYRLGAFATPEAAAFAYDFAAIALHGEFAATNFRLSKATVHRASEFGSFLIAHNTRAV